MWFGKEADLSRDIIRFEDVGGNLVGFVALSDLSGLIKSNILLYAILPEYFDTTLPQQVIEAGISLGRSQNIQDLEIETSRHLSTPFEKSLEYLGYHPIHFSLELHLLELNPSFLPSLPQGLTFQKSPELFNMDQYIEVYNKAFQGSFGFEKWTMENFEMLQETQ